MKKTLTLAFIVFSTLSWQSASAQTGDLYIGFPSPDSILTGDSVHLYFHVPASYQEGTPTKLIVAVHGFGNPNDPVQIRNYFSAAADTLSAIVLAPKPYLGELLSIDHPLNQHLLNVAIDSVLEWFTIDTNEVYIAGYSAGSDVASRYVLEDHQHKMKGLIWYAPGFFSKPNLSAFSTFPNTCLCFGTLDPLSNLINQVTSIRDSFALKPQFDFFYNEIPGIDHTMEFYHFTQEMLECFRFIDDPQNFIPDSSYVGANHLTREEFSFYPNPTTGNIFFKGTSVNLTESVTVCDLSGKTVFETAHLSESPSIDLGTLTAGTYLMTLQINGKRYHRRLVVLER